MPQALPFIAAAAAGGGVSFLFPGLATTFFGSLIIAGASTLAGAVTPAIFGRATIPLDP